MRRNQSARRKRFGCSLQVKLKVLVIFGCQFVLIAIFVRVWKTETGSKARPAKTLLLSVHDTTMFFSLSLSLGKFFYFGEYRGAPIAIIS